MTRVRCRLNRRLFTGLRSRQPLARLGSQGSGALKGSVGYALGLYPEEKKGLAHAAEDKVMPAAWGDSIVDL